MGSEGIIQGYLVKINADYPTAPAQIELRNHEITFGRGVGNTVVWESLQISRRHSVMEYKPETHQWRLKDTSTNGMMVNNQKIPKNSFVDLKDQDLISFVPTGSLSYRFVAVPVPEPQQTLSNNNRREIPHITSSNVPQNLTTGRRSAEDDSVEIFDVVTKSPKRKTNHGEEEQSPFVVKYHSTPLGKRKKIPELAMMDVDIDNDDVIALSAPLRDNQVPVISSRNKERSENIPLKTSTADAANDDAKKQLSLFRDQLKRMQSENFELKQKHEKEKEELQHTLQTVQSENRIAQEVAYKKVLDVLENEYSCCICNEVFIQATVVDCGHTFCGHCISEWVKRKTECPNCRKPVKQQSKHTEMENFITKFYEILPGDMMVKRNEIIAERKKEQEDAARAAATAQRNMIPGPRASVYNFAMGGERVNEFFQNIHDIVNPVRLDRMRFMPGPPEVNVVPPRFGAHFMPEMPHLPHHSHSNPPPPPRVPDPYDMRRGAPYPMPPEVPRTRSARRRARPVMTFAPMPNPAGPQPPVGLDFVTVD